MLTKFAIVKYRIDLHQHPEFGMTTIGWPVKTVKVGGKFACEQWMRTFMRRVGSGGSYNPLNEQYEVLKDTRHTRYFLIAVPMEITLKEKVEK